MADDFSIPSEEEIQRLTEVARKRDEDARAYNEERTRRRDAISTASINIDLAISTFFESRFHQPADPQPMAVCLHGLLLAFGNVIDESSTSKWRGEGIPEGFIDAFGKRYYELTDEEKEQAYIAAEFIMKRALSGELSEADMRLVRIPKVGDLTLHFLRAIPKVMTGDLAFSRGAIVNPSPTNEAADDCIVVEDKAAHDDDSTHWITASDACVITGMLMPEISKAAKAKRFKTNGQRGKGVSGLRIDQVDLLRWFLSKKQKD